MAYIKSKRTAGKFTSKTINRREKSCQPNTNLNRDEKDDDSDVEGVKSSQSKEEQKLENNFNNREYKKGSEKKSAKKTKKGKPKESISDSDKKNCLGLGEML